MATGCGRSRISSSSKPTPKLAQPPVRAGGRRPAAIGVRGREERKLDEPGGHKAVVVDRLGISSSLVASMKGARWAKSLAFGAHRRRRARMVVVRVVDVGDAADATGAGVGQRSSPRLRGARAKA